MECTCFSIDLFNFGCRCGAFAFEQSLHIWFNGLDYVIARSQKEADSWLSKYLEKPIYSNWELYPEADELTIGLGEDEVTKPAKDWIKRYGPGFLASLDASITDAS